MRVATTLSTLLTAGLLAAAPPIAAADTIVCLVREMSFVVTSPVPGQGTAHATINAGDTVRWEWVSDFHSVTSDVPGLFDSDIHNTGHIFEVTFDFGSGDFPYHCILHGAPGGFGMAGTITVLEPAGCYANCDESTVAPVLNVDDFTCFINAFATAQTLGHAQQVEHYANCDGSTIAPALNVDDFTCFINQFALGCP